MFGRMARVFGGGSGRAQPEALRTTRDETVATLLDGRTKATSELARGDIVVINAGDVIPADGIVIDGVASVNEAEITGESAPVIRESDSVERSAVSAGTRVLSGRIAVELNPPPTRS